ncbi:MAG: hypothetical protein M3P16_12025 [Chloroflexota bacterium]|nr:hypothetical protein [Chloroflexota bacterium]
MRGLDGLTHRLEQLAFERAQIDLLAQSRGEGVEGPLGVVSPAARRRLARSTL